jgi:pre-rRNA-processing protein TSR4
MSIRSLSGSREESRLKVNNVFGRRLQTICVLAVTQNDRYELDGVPLPFASDEVFESMFPAPTTVPLPVTKPDFKVVITPKRVYTPASIPPCSICNSTRVFECQLMPNLINVLSSSDSNHTAMTDEERRHEVARELRTSNKSENTGMEWGTCIIFSCQNDCCINEEGKGEGKECWREEVVLIQWDN